MTLIDRLRKLQRARVAELRIRCSCGLTVELLPDRPDVESWAEVSDFIHMFGKVHAQAPPHGLRSGLDVLKTLP
jgi:hypothetical protein